MARTGWGQMGYQITTGSDDPNKVISKNRWNLPVNKGSGILGFAAQSVASASTITPSKSVVVLSGSTEVTKFLTGDSEEYDILYVFKASGASCTLTNTTGTPNADGQIVGLGSASTIALSETIPKIFIRKSNGSHQLWVEYGGSGTAAASELTGTTLASNVITSSLTTVGALNAGSITSDFGNINIGSSNFTSTGTVTCDVTGDLTGNADTATAATNATNTTNIITADDSPDTSCNVLFVNAAEATQQAKTGSNLTFNANTGMLTADGFTGALTGNASSATSATTAAVATKVTIGDNESTNEDNAIIFTAGGAVTGGNLDLESDGTCTYNPSTGKITATGFIGDVTGDVSGSSGSCSGLSATATALATGRTIGMTGDVVWTSASFNGTGNVTATSVIQAGAVDIAMINASGSAGATTFLRGDGSWQTAGGGAENTIDTKLRDEADSDPSYTSRTENDASTPIQIWSKTLDSNNENLYVRVKKNGSYTNVQIA